jgi:hypothetical protein
MNLRAESFMTFGMIAGLGGAVSAAYVGAPTALVTLIGAIGLGWGALRGGILLARVGAPTPSRSEVRAVGLALLVVSTGVATPAMSGSAEAQTTQDYLDLSEQVRECNPWEAAANDFLRGGLIKQFSDLSKARVCTEHYYQSQALENEELQAEADLKTAAASQAQSSANYLAGHENTLQDTETVAWSKAEIAIAEAYENGKNRSQAQAEAKAAIRDYYSVRQRNLAASYSTGAETYVSILNTTRNDSDINLNVYPTGDTPVSNVDTAGGEGPPSEEVSAQTVNGSSVTIVGIRYNDDGATSSRPTATPHNSPGSIKTFEVNGTVVVDAIRYQSAWTRIETQSSGLTGEVDPYVNATYDGLENGTINSSDIVSKAALVGQLGTDYRDATTSGQGNVYNSVGALAAQGLEVPELNGTGTFTVEYTANGSTKTADGLLAARQAPGGSWETNTTYNASEISGPVYLAKTDGEVVSLSGEFTVTEIRDRDGNSIQNVTAQEVVYQSQNVTELSEKLDRLSNYRAQIEARSPLYGGGLGGLLGGDSGPIVVIVAAAVVLLLLRGGS